MDELHAAVQRAGGLFSRAGLAKRWSVSKAYVSEAVKHPDFPAPIEIDDGGERGREVWSGNEADTWRETPRRPGPRPR